MFPPLDAKQLMLLGRKFFLRDDSLLQQRFPDYSF